jgi:hypothetical protein
VREKLAGQRRRTVEPPTAVSAGCAGLARRCVIMKLFTRTLCVGVAALGVLSPIPLTHAATPATPAAPEKRSESSQSVQKEVEKKSADEAIARRKKIVADATEAIAETTRALKALEEKKKDEALNSLALATGKLELILARDPKLALAPLATEVVVHDLLANPETIELMIKEAKSYLNDGEMQKVRPIVANLASEIEYRTTNIPLATYPAAIKAITPLIDVGNIEEAKKGLQEALNTLVITTDLVVPLPKHRAEELLKLAQGLSEKKDRTNKENDDLANDLKEARNQLKIAELLGYGDKKAYKPMYDQLEEIEKKSAGGKSGTGWFDKIKKQLSELF